MKKSYLPVRGTKDFLPSEMEIREKIREIILNTYSESGFSQIKTPIIEDIDLLLGSEGGENLRLIYKILKRGEKLNLNVENENDLVDLGLRYDLTVPLVRFYLNNKENLLPVFKAIQIDDVFRAERPQKGRSRQFMQCDIDIINESNNIAEIEILHVAGKTLLNLGFKNFAFKISDRRLLNELLFKSGFQEKDFIDVAISLDKLDKIDIDGVKQELIKKGYQSDLVKTLLNNIERIKLNGIEELRKLNLNEEIINNLEEILTTSNALAKDYIIEFDINIIRGQGYYTSLVIEVYLDGFDGACGGGGRYDDMIEKMGGLTTPAIGFSFGFERLFLIMMENNYSLPLKSKLALIYEDENIQDILNLANDYQKYYQVTILQKRRNFKFQLKTLKENNYKKYVLFKDNQIEAID